MLVRDFLNKLYYSSAYMINIYEINTEQKTNIHYCDYENLSAEYLEAEIEDFTINNNTIIINVIF